MHHRAHEKKWRSLHPQCKKTVGHLGSLTHFRENRRRTTFQNLSEKEKWTGWNLLTAQKNIENAAKYKTPNECTERPRNDGNSRACQITSGSCCKMYGKNQEESTQETSQESQSRTIGKVRPGVDEKEGKKKNADIIVC